MQLSQQQSDAFDLIQKWIKSGKPKFVLSGYAGTGKTTLAKYIADSLGQSNVIFCAFTGKAANVLRDKGCENSGTIHSFLYKYTKDDETGKPTFRKLSRHESDLNNCKLVICDEYSMLPKDIVNDLLSVSKRVLFLGDDFQLPPVSGECVLQPDYRLTDVQRQALDSGIIQAATKVRLGETLDYTMSDDFVYQPKSKANKDWYYEASQTIVGYNDTRTKWNKVFLEKNFPYENVLHSPIVGAKVICLKNNNQRGIFNGMIGVCSEYNHQDHKMVLSVDDYKIYGLPVYNGSWLVERPDIYNIDRELCVFDYGYAITCHKSQGSEYPIVLINNEALGKTPEERRRWTYTALTRAQKKAYLLDPRS